MKKNIIPVSLFVISICLIMLGYIKKDLQKNHEKINLVMKDKHYFVSYYAGQHKDIMNKILLNVHPVTWAKETNKESCGNTLTPIRIVFFSEVPESEEFDY